MKNILFCLFTILLTIGCGDKDDDQEMMEMDTCGGSLTINVDGESISFGKPEQAFLSYNALNDAHELGVIWTLNGSNVNFQLLLDLGSETCVPIKRNTLTNLSSEVSLFSIQYSSFEKQGSVSNAFFEEGDTGYIEITRCDDSDDTIDLEFGFSGSTIQGESLTVTSAKVENVCFSRTK